MLIFAIIGFMYFTGEVLKPLALSVLLSFAMAPAARFAEQLGLPRAAAVLLTVVDQSRIAGRNRLRRRATIDFTGQPSARLSEEYRDQAQSNDQPGYTFDDIPVERLGR